MSTDPADDHEAVAGTLPSFPQRWVVSYDYAPEILALYQKYACVVYDLRYSAQERYDGAEAIFFGAMALREHTARREPSAGALAPQFE